MNNIRLLFLTRDANAAEAVIARVRRHGHAVRAQSCDDEACIDETIETFRPEALVVLATTLDLGVAETWMDRHSQAGRLPPVVWVEQHSVDTAFTLLESGIYALCPPDSPDLVALYVIRAAEHAKNLAALRKLEQAVRESDDRCRLLLDHSKDAIAYIHEGLHLYANEAWLERFEIEDTDEALTLTLLDLVERDDREALKAFLREAERPGQHHQRFNFRGLRGAQFDAEINVSPAHLQSEQCQQIVLQTSDALSPVEIERLATIDPGTGLANRRHFLSQLQRAIADAGNDDGESFSVVLLGVDRLDHHRAQLGVARTDDLLAACARLIRDSLPENAIGAHLEAETFGILLPGARRSSAESAMQTLHQITNDALLDLTDASVQINTSAVGIAGGVYSEGADALLPRALKELGNLQRAGGQKARFITVTRPDTRSSSNDATWKALLREALDERRVSLAFQPIVSLRGEVQPNFNVFVRVTDGDGVTHDAHDFIDVAERAGLAQEIDRFVLMHAAARLKSLLTAHPEMRLFVKLSAHTLSENGAIEKIFEDFGRLQVPADRLVIEIRESAILTHLKPAMAVAATLARIGSALCLVEFGNGLDPEKMLGLVKPNFVKLDPAQIERLKQGDEDLGRWVQTTHDIGACFMVSHVENAELLAQAFALNIDYAQGNFIQAPTDGINFDFEAF
ncbi:MAG: EAL domain-containing protein [Thioalkalivibrionaceae bacterium]